MRRVEKAREEEARTGEVHVAFLPMVGAIIVSANLANIVLLPRIGPKLFVAPGMLAAAGLAWLTRIGVHSSYSTDVLPPLLLASTGLGFVMSPSMNTGTADVASSDAGAASAMVNTGQQVGGSIGTSLLNTMAASAAASYLASHPSPRLMTGGHPAPALAELAQVRSYTTGLSVRNGFDWPSLDESSLAGLRRAAGVVDQIIDERDKRADHHSGPAGGSPARRAALRVLLWPLRKAAQRSQAPGEAASPNDVPLGALVPAMHYDAQLVPETEGTLHTFAGTPADVLLLGGSKSPAYLKTSLDALASVLPRAQRFELAGRGHLAPDNQRRPRTRGPGARVILRQLSQPQPRDATLTHTRRAVHPGTSRCGGCPPRGHPGKPSRAGSPPPDRSATKPRRSLPDRERDVNGARGIVLHVPIVRNPSRQVG